MESGQPKYSSSSREKVLNFHKRDYISYVYKYISFCFVFKDGLERHSDPLLHLFNDDDDDDDVLYLPSLNYNEKTI